MPFRELLVMAGISTARQNTSYRWRLSVSKNSESPPTGRVFITGMIPIVQGLATLPIISIAAMYA